ncbi:uncharacterized protein LOC130725208 [Lotus japonicus]|uniref:uncharacterized protein LOC130725208 n=1 Tax=Lotus japonicus TaxID=34305 RepID=UPI0025911220|nr:uncharacterized protein LOC130725208 [Lotus japonicus]
MARRLRPYFQSFPVRVQTDLPLRQVLQNPDLSRRLVAWSVELSEYGLQYDKRGTMSAQSLVDFVVELTHDSGERVSTQWNLFVDGSSNNNGSGAGVTFEGLGELALEQSLKFEFHATNNQAEYEALIAGLKLAIEVKIESFLIRTDSQLVASQVMGAFQSHRRKVFGMQGVESRILLANANEGLHGICTEVQQVSGIRRFDKGPAGTVVNYKRSLAVRHVGGGFGQTFSSR